MEKNCYKWSISVVLILGGKARDLGGKADPLSVWQLGLFTEDILLHTVKNTEQ